MFFDFSDDDDDEEEEDYDYFYGLGGGEYEGYYDEDDYDDLGFDYSGVHYGGYQTYQAGYEVEDETGTSNYILEPSKFTAVQELAPLLHKERALMQPFAFGETIPFSSSTNYPLQLEGMAAPVTFPLHDPTALKAHIAAKGTHNEVEKSWELPASAITVASGWDDKLKGILQSVKRNFVHQDVEIVATLDKLVLYENTSSFKSHSEPAAPESDVFGTLILQLPSDYIGGRLTVRHEGYNAVKIARAEHSRYMMNYLALFSGCEYDLESIVFGHQFSLVYKLSCPGVTGANKPASYVVKTPLSAPKETSQEDIASIRGILAKWNDEANPKFIAIPLENEYDGPQLALTSLRGADDAMAKMLQEVLQDSDASLGMANVVLQKTKGESSSYTKSAYRVTSSTFEHTLAGDLTSHQFTARNAFSFVKRVCAYSRNLFSYKLPVLVIVCGALNDIKLARTDFAAAMAGVLSLLKTLRTPEKVTEEQRKKIIRKLFVTISEGSPYRGVHTPATVQKIRETWSLFDEALSAIMDLDDFESSKVVLELVMQDAPCDNHALPLVVNFLSLFAKKYSWSKLAVTTLIEKVLLDKKNSVHILTELLPKLRDEADYKSLYARKAIEYATLAEDSVVELVHYFINYGDQDDLVMLANAISEAQVSDVIAMLAADTPRTADEVLLPVKSCIEIFLGRLVTAQKNINSRFQAQLLSFTPSLVVGVKIKSESAVNELLSLASMDYKLLPFFKGFLELVDTRPKDQDKAFLNSIVEKSTALIAKAPRGSVSAADLVTDWGIFSRALQVACLLKYPPLVKEIFSMPAHLPNAFDLLMKTIDASDSLLFEAAFPSILSQLPVATKADSVFKALLYLQTINQHDVVRILEASIVMNVQAAGIAAMFAVPTNHEQVAKLLSILAQNKSNAVASATLQAVAAKYSHNIPEDILKLPSMQKIFQIAIATIDSSTNPLTMALLAQQTSGPQLQVLAKKFIDNCNAQQWQTVTSTIFTSKNAKAIEFVLETAATLNNWENQMSVLHVVNLLEMGPYLVQLEMLAAGFIKSMSKSWTQDAFSTIIRTLDKLQSGPEKKTLAIASFNAKVEQCVSDVSAVLAKELRLIWQGHVRPVLTFYALLAPAVTAVYAALKTEVSTSAKTPVSKAFGAKDYPECITAGCTACPLIQAFLLSPTDVVFQQRMVIPECTHVIKTIEKTAALAGVIAHEMVGGKGQRKSLRLTKTVFPEDIRRSESQHVLAEIKKFAEALSVIASPAAVVPAAPAPADDDPAASGIKRESEDSTGPGAKRVRRDD